MASVFNLLPILVMPVIVLGKLDSADAGYYFIAFQITSLLSGVAFAVTQSLLAEVGHAETSLRTLAKRSARILAITIIPPALVLGIGGKWLLLVFGSNYSENAWQALAVLALSAPAVAAYGWTVTLLKATGQLRVDDRVQRGVRRRDDRADGCAGRQGARVGRGRVARGERGGGDLRGAPRCCAIAVSPSSRRAASPVKETSKPLFWLLILPVRSVSMALKG